MDEKIQSNTTSKTSFVRKQNVFYIFIFILGFALGIVFLVIFVLLLADRNPNLTISPLPTPITVQQNNEVKESNCGVAPDIWQFLSEDLKNKVSDERLQPSIRTYELHLHEWSKLCDWFAFSLELVARGAEAYEPEDFDPRGIYLFNKETQEMILVNHPEQKSTINYLFWSADENLIFEETFYEGNGRRIIQEYSFDTASQQLELHPN